MKRRSYLTSLAAAGSLTAVAGCVNVLSGSDSGIRLGSLRIANTTEDTRTVDLRIERNNESVYRGTSEIPGNDEVWIDPTWSSEPATYDFYYVLSGLDELQIKQLTEPDEEDPEGECLFADLWIVDTVEDSVTMTKDVAEQEEATCNF